jgi:glyoxylase-like metal-dependent hydrolase (beta-lactamase superfamily II)
MLAKQTDGEIMKITDEVFQVGGSEFTSHEDAAIYLINFDGHAALVDAGCGTSTERLFSNIRSCGVNLEDIEYLFITHCHYDHTGGAKDVKDMTGCQAVAHELDAEFLEAGDDSVTAATWYGARLEPLVIERKLSLSSEQIQLGGRNIEAIHTPGHSPGSVVYVTESQGLKVLFGQDVHGPLNASFLSNRQEYLKSLDLLLSHNADLLCEGHYGVYIGKDEVQKFIRSFMPNSL